MEIKKETIKKKGLEVPCVTLQPVDSHGAVVVAHGYGGMKEETIGLAWHIAMEGFTTGAIDLRGHGENPLLLDKNIQSDLDTAVSYFRKYGKVTVVGHSLGGRIALTSNADYAIGISPALSKSFNQETIDTIEELRDYRVRKTQYNLSKLLKDLPPSQFEPDRSLVIYGTRDLPEIIAECEKLKLEGSKVIQIEEALHNDIFLYEPTFKIINQRLKQWYRTIPAEDLRCHRGSN